MKKGIVAFLLLVGFSILYADSYKISNIEYKLKGSTRKSSLEQRVPIDTSIIFNTLDDLEIYLENVEKEISNNRIFEEAKVSIISIEKDGNINNVFVEVYTKDTWNIIGLPYPSYDSNSGLKLRLKIKNYNFLGSMETFDSTVNYQFNTENNSHKFDFSFTIPFPSFTFLTMKTSVDTDVEFSYTIGDSFPGFKTSQNIFFEKNINKFIDLNLKLSNIFYVAPEFEKYNDTYYFTEEILFYTPIKLAEINNYNDLKWSPYLGFSFNWDFDAFSNHPNFGLNNPDLFGPKILIGHSVGVELVNWVGNFRNGFSILAKQNVEFNLNNKKIDPIFSFETNLFKKFNDNLALTSRLQYFINVNGNQFEKGDLLRGIKNNLFETNSSIIINLDLPIKMFQTNWKQMFNTIGLNWNWTSVFDFEMQFNPFIDVALCKNLITNTQFLFEDGFYSTGFELLVYPNKMKSII